MSCAAKYTDGEWYRAEVLSLLKGETVQVNFVDYGNSEYVNLKDVRVLNQNFIDLMPAQAIHCSLYVSVMFI